MEYQKQEIIGFRLIISIIENNLRWYNQRMTPVTDHGYSSPIAITVTR